MVVLTQKRRWARRATRKSTKKIFQRGMLGYKKYWIPTAAKMVKMRSGRAMPKRRGFLSPGLPKMCLNLQNIYIIQK